MSWDRALESLMTTGAIVVYDQAATTGKSLYGEVEWSTAGTSYTARVVKRFGVNRNRDGESVGEVATAWIASTGQLHPEDKYELDDGSTPSVLVMEHFPDQDGIHHVKVMFGGRRGDR